jgi:hypothetical protein
VVSFMDCPWCLILPALVLLRKISNHLELVKPEPGLRAADPAQVRILSLPPPRPLQ